MYAIVATGGKQYRVSVGDLIDIEKIDKSKGEKVELDKVLMTVADNGEVLTGEPVLEDISVIGRVVRQYKDKKVTVFKKKRRKGYKRKYGHRQQYTQLKIEEIKDKSKEEIQTESESEVNESGT